MECNVNRIEAKFKDLLAMRVVHDIVTLQEINVKNLGIPPEIRKSHTGSKTNRGHKMDILFGHWLIDVELTILLHYDTLHR